MRRAVLLGVAAACVASVTTATAQQNGAAAQIAEGRVIALGGVATQPSAPCAQCHGIDGAGSGPFPALAGQGSWYLYKALRDYASGRRQSEVMRPFAQTLSDREAQAVALYFASLSPAAGQTRLAGSAAQRQYGGVINAAGLSQVGAPACANCHGSQGQGMPPVFPSLAGQPAAYLQGQLHAWKRGERGGDPLNVMREIAQTMTDEQIAAVAAYFASVSPASAARAQPATAAQSRRSEPASTGTGELEQPPYLRPER